MTLKFNPPKHLGRYALFVEYGDDRGKLYQHDDLGSAKNSYHAHGHHNNAKILENVGGQWYVLFDIPKGTDYKDLPWVKEVTIGGWYSNRTGHRARPMTRDEYAEWRIQVERERLHI
jgi:hypothetical protein